MPFDDEYDRAKAKFYADPKFAAVVGAIVGFVIGIVLF